MNYLIIILLLITTFLFIIYIPTVLFYNYTNYKGKQYHILLFLSGALLFLIFNYLCTLFYDMRAYGELSECVNSLINYNCFFSKYLSRIVEPTISLMMIFLMQFLSFVLFSYITVKMILMEKKERKIIIYMLIFFLCGILCTGIYYAILNDVNFTGFSSIVACFGMNSYIILPLMYLIYMTFFNKNLLKIKRQKKIIIK